jgi:hypothetical protein
MEAGAVPARTSYERIAVDSLVQALTGLPEAQLYRGQGRGNRFAVTGWEMTKNQQFQFGDLRVETPRATIVVEFESAGTVTNLVKYWPLLTANRLAKRFVIVHVFQLGSEADYIAHRRLWECSSVSGCGTTSTSAASYSQLRGTPGYSPTYGGTRRPTPPPSFEPCPANRAEAQLAGCLVAVRMLSSGN